MALHALRTMPVIAIGSAIEWKKKTFRLTTFARIYPIFIKIMDFDISIMKWKLQWNTKSIFMRKSAIQW